MQFLTALSFFIVEKNEITILDYNSSLNKSFFIEFSNNDCIVILSKTFVFLLYPAFNPNSAIEKKEYFSILISNCVAVEKNKR